MPITVGHEATGGSANAAFAAGEGRRNDIERDRDDKIAMFNASLRERQASRLGRLMTGTKNRVDRTNELEVVDAQGGLLKQYERAVQNGDSELARKLQWKMRDGPVATANSAVNPKGSTSPASYGR